MNLKILFEKLRAISRETVLPGDPRTVKTKVIVLDLAEGLIADEVREASFRPAPAAAEPTAKQSRMRRFVLERSVDATGTSGVGVVAEGVELSNGHVLMTWLSQHQTWSHYDNEKVMTTLHGHGGNTRVVWLDPEAP